MMFVKPPLEVLVHFGVKGMHWGQRKTQPANAKYTASQRSIDARDLGKGGVRRINKSMNAGRSRQASLAREHQLRLAKGFAGAAAIYVAGVLIQHGDDLLVNVLKDASTRQGAKTVGQIMSTAAKTPYAKNKRGVFKITTM